ncbi:hypothetical protein [Helicobacter anatolicus]|uniref:hypothetical protein n=1 Tax=Helicobacter anatolicus TaxID=2905874 RepID=UPI001E331BF1|nr:hypothetical protein [Helicobacter anatolicus]
MSKKINDCVSKPIKVKKQKEKSVKIKLVIVPNVEKRKKIKMEPKIATPKKIPTKTSSIFRKVCRLLNINADLLLV